MENGPDFIAQLKRLEEQQRELALAFEIPTFGQQFAASISKINADAKSITASLQTTILGHRVQFDRFAKTPSFTVRFTDEFVEKLKEVGAFIHRAEGFASEVLQFLIEHSWYIGANTTPFVTVRIKQMMENKDTESAIDEEMARAYREATSYVLADLSRLFPSRSRIITDAFEAHAAGKYTLSVPVMLAQADGIAYEVINRYFFQGKPESSSLLKAKAQASGELQKGLVESLMISGSLRATGRTHAVLNRHSVLHGTSTDYPTVVSSLKCISLLDYFLLIIDAGKELFE